MMKYQDIHTTDSALWKQYQDHMAKGEYDAAKAILVQTQLDNKRIDASLFNTITTELTRLQNQGKDSTWSKNVMYVGESAPSSIKQGECWLKNTKQLSYSINVKNSVYINDPTNMTNVEIGDYGVVRDLDAAYDIQSGERVILKIHFPEGGRYHVTYKDGTASSAIVYSNQTKTFNVTTNTVITNNVFNRTVNITEQRSE